MLKKIEFSEKPDRDHYKQEIDALELRLRRLQREIIDHKIPALLMFEGWAASGKGTVINRLMQNLDPRHFTVYPINQPSTAESLRPYLWRYLVKTPARGRMTILDKSWYRDLIEEEVAAKGSEPLLDSRYRQIEETERLLADDGVVVLKFFMHISRKEQHKRFNELESDPSTGWRIDKEDWKFHKRYKKFRKAYGKMIEHTDRRHAPWIIVPAEHRRTASLTVLRETIKHLQRALARKKRQDKKPPRPPRLAVRRKPPLASVDLSKTMSREEYGKRLRPAQERLRELQHLCFVHRLPVTIVYQGWDAAGKGGNIRRLTQRMDPRGYEVIPIGAPSKNELSQHYLWRFWRKVPKDGHIAIFDRSWYGRVLVERVEGFAGEQEWKRAYREINEFERSLVDEGHVFVKFWLHIDQDEQLRRFEERQKNRYKRWKITDEDWRNREKWGQYEEAVNQMLSLTSTADAPWTIIEGNSKYFARIKALDTVINAISAKIDTGKKDR